MTASDRYLSWLSQQPAWVQRLPLVDKLHMYASDVLGGFR